MAEEQDDMESVSAYAEVGGTGLQRAGGFITEEFLTVLRGRKAAQIFREMSDNDPLIGSILFAIDKLIRQAPWEVTSDNEETKTFIEECMNDMDGTWPDLISEIMSMLPYGWSYFEMVFKQRLGDQPGTYTTANGDDMKMPNSKYDDGKIGWSKIAARSQDSLLKWGFDDNGTILGMWQTPAPDYKARWLPIQKCLLFRTSTLKNNPEGRSVLRNAYRPWYFKKRIEEIESIGIERDLAGFPLLYMDPDIMSSQKATDKAIYEEYKKIIRNIRRDQQEGLILPSVFDESGNKLISLELLSSGGSRAFDTTGIIGRYQSEIAMSVLADFILLGHEAVGSFALSNDKTELFAVALGAWLKSIAAVFNDTAIPMLLKLNGLPTDTNTELVPGDIEEMPLESIITLLEAMDGMGSAVFPNDDMVEFLYKRARLPFSPDAINEFKPPVPVQIPAPAPEAPVPEG